MGILLFGICTKCHPDEFRVAADAILNKLNITRMDITFYVAKTLFYILVMSRVNNS